MLAHSINVISRMNSWYQKIQLNPDYGKSTFTIIQLLKTELIEISLDVMDIFYLFYTIIILCSSNSIHCTALLCNNTNKNQFIETPFLAMDTLTVVRFSMYFFLKWRCFLHVTIKCKQVSIISFCAFFVICTVI